MRHLLSTTAALLFGMASFGLGTMPAHATTYSNVAGSDIQWLGYPNTTAYGEEFVAPGGTLQSWTFTTDGGSPGNLGFVVAKWNGVEAVGPALYTGAAEHASAAPNNTLTWSNINLSLTAGTEYIAFLTVAGITHPTSGISVVGSSGDGGLGGSFYYINDNGADPLTSPTTWSSWNVNDLEFSATFGPRIPEPMTAALLGAGLAGLGLARRKSASSAG